MSKGKRGLSASNSPGLFDRIVSILERSRVNVVRAVNTNMVLAYWLIGREIVQDLQGGEERADYGEQVLENLSVRLTERYGSGFSLTNLRNFRQFYLVYADRADAIRYPTGGELPSSEKSPPEGKELNHPQIRYPVGSEFAPAFSLQLSWSHYRALMRVEDRAARDFYEREATECGWSKAQLERQIQTGYYQRILAHRGPEGLVAANRDRLQGEPLDAGQMLKSPYVLEFLGLPDSKELHESALEEAIINNLQAFLLELGKGFSFVARQKHL